MASLGDITTAASGLAAARRLIDVAGQNIGNAQTTGYTRRTVTIQSQALQPTTGQSTPVVSGGVVVSTTQRAASEPLNAQVRVATANSSYASTRSTALGTLEDSLGTLSSGVSTDLTSFWSSWSSLASDSTTASASAVIQAGQTLVSDVSNGYATAASQWTSTRTALSGDVDNLNSDADQLAAVNRSLTQAAATGQDTSDLLDQRDSLLTSISGLAGGTTTFGANGEATVLIGGGVLVDATSAHHVALSSSTTPGSDVSLSWTGNGGGVAVDGGSMAAELSLIAPANDSGTGGSISQVLAGYNTLATQLASAVNAVHETGTSSSGATGLAFFAIGDASSAASTLSVVPTSASGVATAASGSGSYDTSVADSISQLGSGTSAPDTAWTALVARIGTQTAAETTAATTASTALSSANSAQQSVSSVDLDEENENLMSAQSAYQANARVLTAIDQMLDTLINKTGLVGISG